MFLKCLQYKQEIEKNICLPFKNDINKNKNAYKKPKVREIKNEKQI